MRYHVHNPVKVGLTAAAALWLVIAIACTVHLLIPHHSSSPASAKAHADGAQIAAASTVSPVSNASYTSNLPVASVDETSNNWAGYVADDATYTAISGSWVVPAATGSTNSLSADATWIGIGGKPSKDLIQVGTQETIVNNTVERSAFYELVPNNVATIAAIKVHAGDTIAASLREIASNQWRITIQNLTSRQTYSTTVHYTSTKTSAEWIQEAPSNQNGLMSLDQFGTVTFFDATTVQDGEEVTVFESDAQVMALINSAGDYLANVSQVNSTGDSFSITRTNVDSGIL